MANSPVNFAAATNSAIGGATKSVVIADFNGDRISDLVSANNSTGNVSIQLGDGKGGFDKATNFAVGTGVTSVAVLDINRDRNPDLAVTTSTGVFVLLGDGRGTFGKATNLAPGTGFSTVAVADFNRDSISDLVTNTGDNLSVFLGDGNGGFGKATNFPGGGATINDLAMGDFNGDRIPDIANISTVVGNYLFTGVSIQLGDGKGGFTKAIRYGLPASITANKVTVGDVNGDSIPDILTNNGYVFLGDGKGVFGTGTNLGIGAGVSSVVGDLNGDGIADIATVTSGNVSVFLGDGKGAFGTPFKFVVPAGADSIAIGDLNVDGRPDLVVGGTSSQTSVLLNTNDYTRPTISIADTSTAPGTSGTVQAVFTVSLSRPSPETITVDYTTADGTATVAEGDYTALTNRLVTFAPLQTSQTINVSVNGTREVEGTETFTLNLSNAKNAAGITRSTATGTILNLNGPVNNPPVVANPISAQSIISGSALNFSLAANTFTDPDAGDVLSYSAKLANGSNLPTWLTFDATTRTFAGTPAAGDAGNLSIAVIATDKAGLKVASNFGLNVTAANKPPIIGEKADILWRNDYGSVALWQMDGATIVNAALTSIQSIDSSWTVAGTGDFNGDKKSDVLWRNDNGAVDIWQMDGSTVVSNSLASIALLDNSWKTAGTGDFNGDGKADILWRNDNGAVDIWQMNGSTVTSSSLTSTPSLDKSWKTAGTGDFNGDGKSDILWRNDDGSIALWQMDGSNVISSSLTSTPSLDSSWKINGTGDFNADGKADILWSNSKTGAMAIWQMNGSTVVDSSLVSTPLPDSSWKFSGIGDFNGDGKSDLLWRNANNAVDIWQMNGSTVVSSTLTSTPADSSNWRVAGVIV